MFMRGRGIYDDDKKRVAFGRFEELCYSWASGVVGRGGKTKNVYFSFFTCIFFFVSRNGKIKNARVYY